MFRFYYSFKGEIQCPVHLEPLHFAQNAPEGTVLDPVFMLGSNACFEIMYFVPLCYI